MTHPDVTVAIPTRNRTDLLSRTLRSVLGQTDVACEVVVVDDGSGPEQAKRVAALAGRRVRVVRNETSQGVASARNRGAAAGRGQWVAFCDDDDVWAPGKLARQLRAARAAGSSWVYTGAVKFSDGPLVWQIMPPPDPEDVQSRLAHKNIIPAGASNVLAKRRTFLDLGGFDAALRHLADWDAWLRLLEHGPPARAAGVSVGYRLHPQAMSMSPAGIIEELAVLDPRWRHLRGGQPLDFGPTHLWIATSYLRAGHRAHAAASYARAARTAPKAGLRGIARTLHPRTPRPSHDAARTGDGPRAGSLRQLALSADMLEVLHDLA